MPDYPEFFPPFMRGFSDQKRLVKAFFTWRYMMDSRNNSTVAERSNFIDFMPLFVSMIDFLHIHGWQIYKSRRKDSFADIDESVSTLNELEAAWGYLLDPDGLQPSDQHRWVHGPIEKWSAWLPYMPKEVQEAWPNK